jgi:hypothetical protein
MSNSTLQTSSSIDILDKYFNENSWYELTNLNELIKLTGLDSTFIKVISTFGLYLFIYKKHIITIKHAISFHFSVILKVNV